MSRLGMLVLGCILAIPALAANVKIGGLYDSVDDRYDLTWSLQPAAGAGPLVITVEAGKEAGYVLELTSTKATWKQLNSKSAVPPVSGTVTLPAGKKTLFSLKRRAETVALLQDHRLVLTAPAQVNYPGTLAFQSVPAGWTVSDARYNKIGNIVFGDDFMRPESVRKIPAGDGGWLEDDTWKVAYYLKDNPGSAPPVDDTTKKPKRNPWELSLYPSVESTANGFWYLYRGPSPSWVIANDKMSYPTWDRYYFQAAVKPEYDSEIGIIAAYQDNKNYILFRWKSKELRETDAKLAELVAVVNGQPKVLASSPRGFDPVQWYNLRINLGWRRVQALVDGEVLLDAENSGPVEGRVGLYANGSPNPRRPKVDELTATMYVAKDDTGKMINDAADAMRKTSVIYFDDIKVGDWVTMGDLRPESGYAVAGGGKWKVNDGVITSQSAGRLLTGSPTWSSYVATARMQMKAGVNGGMLFHMKENGTGYAWLITPKGQQLQPLTKDTWEQPVDTAPFTYQAGEWVDLRVEADGPYVACYCNNQRVLESYDPTRVAGRSGLLSPTGNCTYAGYSITLNEKKYRQLEVHEGFDQDKWLVTWSSAEADWYPAFTPKAYVTPAGLPHSQIGNAAPLPTTEAGTYWHKGGHYHDLRVTIPASKAALAGQTLHITSNYEPNGGYRLFLNTQGTQGIVQLFRKNAQLGEYPFPLAKKNQLVVERRGGILTVTAQELNPEESLGSVEVLKETPVIVYRDQAPIKAEMVGFTVTTPALSAAKVVVESDRVLDTFERAPAEWLTESGIWAVMARYSCQPKWNWFGGFGPQTPTVWSKYHLDGDQNVEVYLGVKMQFDNQVEEYTRRYRDLNVTICADGSHLNSGYSVIRGGRPEGTPVTMLLRKGVVVQSTSNPDFVLPAQNRGHRMWFATRLEKRGNLIKVFLDNKLAMTYTDPDPIPGGYVGFWTLNNGMMIGRANLSADRMMVGSPRAATPLAIQEDLAELAAPKVTVNGTPVDIAGFEAGTDGWQARPGITAGVIRERVTLPDGGVNTYLKAVNMYPSGDFGVGMTGLTKNLTQAPIFHMDYCFDPGAKVNLYVKRGDIWYEFLLTGKEAQEVKLYTVTRLNAQADGQWHHLELDLGGLLRNAIVKQGGTVPADLFIQEIALADWSASPVMRAYGFGNNPGGLAIRVDNIAFMPAIRGPLTFAWTDATLHGWRTTVNNAPIAMPKDDPKGTTLQLPAAPNLRFLHLQGFKDGKAGGTLHIPIPGAK